MKKLVQDVKRWFTSPTEELGRCARFLVFQVRIWKHCIRLLGVNRSGTQAAALSYYTIFGTVPAAIVMLMIFQMFPAYREVGTKVRDFTYEQLNLNKIEYPANEKQPQSGPSPAPKSNPGGINPAEQPGQPPSKSQGQIRARIESATPTISIAQKMDELTDHYLNKLNTGAIGIASGLLVIYAAIALLSTIEKAFNMIYRIPAGRSFLHRMINYWSLLTLGPLLLGVGIHMTTRFMMMKGLHQGLIPYVQPLFPFMISVLMFFFMYYTLPNTRVAAGPALYGAAVAALLWSAAKWGFGMYVTRFVPFNAVWGILGIIPLTVVWIYWTWIFILFGLQLTYATQNLQTLDAAELARARRVTAAYFLANDQTVTRMMEFVLRVFEQKDERPVSVEQVASNMQMPIEFARKVLDQLVKAGLLCHTNDPTEGYVPATDGVHISLTDISRAVDELSFGQANTVENPRMKSVFHEIRQAQSRYTLKDVLEPFSKEQLKKKTNTADMEDRHGKE